MRHAHKETGFTLVELMVVIALIAILTWISAPAMREMVGTLGLAEKKRQEATNKAIGNAMLKFARSKNTNGRLPQPFTGNGFFSVPVDASNLVLVDLMNQNGVLRRELNEDGKAGKKVRVYQLDATQSIELPLYFQSGPVVKLDYDIGVIYMTDCGLATACNKAPYSGVSEIYNASTAATWKPTLPEYGATSISTLPLQQSMLDATGRTIDRLRDAFLSYYKDRALQVAANDLSNYYPTGATSQAGSSPSSNQGCRDGWYALDDLSNLILDQVSLNRGQFGVTAWGGSIEFCRKYDPQALGLEAAPPHYGALRINRNLTSGVAPSGTENENIVVTF